jgi:hypothetical protein
VTKDKGPPRATTGGWMTFLNDDKVTVKTWRPLSGDELGQLETWKAKMVTALGAEHAKAKGSARDRHLLSAFVLCSHQLSERWVADALLALLLERLPKTPKYFQYHHVFRAHLDGGYGLARSAAADGREVQGSGPKGRRHDDQGRLRPARERNARKGAAAAHLQPPSSSAFTKPKLVSKSAR